MAYLFDAATGTLRRVALQKDGYSQRGVTPPSGGEVVSDDSDGALGDGDFGGGSNDPVRNQDPANLRRPPMAPRAQQVTGDNVAEFFGDDDVEKVVYRGASRFVLKAIAGNVRLYENRRDGVAQPFTWMVKGVGVTPQYTTDWDKLRNLDWRTPSG